MGRRVCRTALEQRPPARRPEPPGRTGYRRRGNPGRGIFIDGRLRHPKGQGGFRQPDHFSHVVAALSRYTCILPKGTRLPPASFLRQNFKTVSRCGVCRAALEQRPPARPPQPPRRTGYSPRGDCGEKVTAPLCVCVSTAVSGASPRFHCCIQGGRNSEFP